MKYSPFYRILIVLFCFVLVGLIALLPFVNEPNINWTYFYIVIGILVVLFIGVVIWMEVSWAKKYKKEDEEQARLEAEALERQILEEQQKEDGGETHE